MDKVMATPAERNPIVYSNPQFGSIFPRFNMMDYELFWSEYITAFLTGRSVSDYAFATPFFIKKIVKTSCVDSILKQFSFGFVSFSTALSFIIRFIGTGSRAIPSFVRVIHISPERFTASFTTLIRSCLSHAIIIKDNQCEVK